MKISPVNRHIKRSTMGKYLLLPKKEWDRLREWTIHNEIKPDQRNDYFEKLVQRSQNIKKNWPDSIQVS
jgi:hypothetical protein